MTLDFDKGAGSGNTTFFFFLFNLSTKILTLCKEYTRKAKVMRKKDLSGGSVINQMRDDKGLISGPGIGEVKERTNKRLSDST